MENLLSKFSHFSQSIYVLNFRQKKYTPVKKLGVLPFYPFPVVTLALSFYRCYFILLVFYVCFSLLCALCLQYLLLKQMRNFPIVQGDFFWKIKNLSYWRHFLFPSIHNWFQNPCPDYQGQDIYLSENIQKIRFLLSIHNAITAKRSHFKEVPSPSFYINIIKKT